MCQISVKGLHTLNITWQNYEPAKKVVIEKFDSE